MSLPLSGYTPPMGHACSWNIQPPTSVPCTKDVLNHIKQPTSVPWLHFFAEITTPLLGLIIAKVFYASIPGAVFFSIATLTSMTTLATSPRALYLFSQQPVPQNTTTESSFFWTQKSLQKLMQWFVILTCGFSLVGSSPSPLLHIAIPLLTIACIAWPLLMYIDPNHSCIRKYLCHKKINHMLWDCSTLILFGTTLGSLCIRTTAWTSYLQLAACASFTLLCKDSSTELTESKSVAKMKRLEHTILGVGTAAYHFYAIFIDPISANIISALLVSANIFFILFIDAEQEANNHSNALNLQKFEKTLSEGLASFNYSTGECSETDSLKTILQQRKQQSSPASWYFPTRALHYALLGVSLISAPLPLQPASLLLKIFFLSQIISTTTDYILKQIEASARESLWSNKIQSSPLQDLLGMRGNKELYLQTLPEFDWVKKEKSELSSSLS